MTTGKAQVNESEKTTAMADSQVAKGLLDVKKRIEEATSRSSTKPPRLVAVGKTKPLGMVCTDERIFSFFSFFSFPLSLSHPLTVGLSQIVY